MKWPNCLLSTRREPVTQAGKEKSVSPRPQLAGSPPALGIILRALIVRPSEGAEGRAGTERMKGQAGPAESTKLAQVESEARFLNGFSAPFSS